MIIDAHAHLWKKQKGKLTYEEKDAKVTDLTPWKYLTPVSIGLLIIVALIYVSIADFSVFSEGKPKYPTVQKFSGK